MYRHAARSVISDRLIDANWSALGGLNAIHPFSHPGLGIDEGRVLIFRDDLVIGAYSQGHPRTCGTESQNHALVRVPIFFRNEHLVGKFTSLARVSSLLGVVRSSMVLVHAVLTVKDLRANNDRSVTLEHRHLDAN